MKIDREKRKVIAASHSITSAIAEKLRENHEKSKSDKIDVTQIATDLAERRVRMLREDSEEE